MARTAAAGRTAATNRTTVQDMKCSLSFDGTSSLVLLTQNSGLPLYRASGYSVSMWVKVTSFSSERTLFAEGLTSNTSPNFNISVAAGNNDRISVYLRNSSGTVHLSGLKNARLRKNAWEHVVWVDNAGSCSLYINGADSGVSFSYTPSGTYGFDTTTFGAHKRTTTTNYLSGNLCFGQLFSYALNPQQVIATMNGSLNGNIGSYTIGEGAGTIAYDTSGNGNHGTITAGTYTADVPTKKRGVVGGNLVYNGDFEYAPPFVAATTTGSRWVDGTAAGSTTNNLYRWAASYIVSGANAAFDTAVSKSGNSSMRLSTTDASGQIVLSQSLSSGAPSEYEARNILIAVLPNTSYTLTAWVKTNNVAANGVWADIREFSGDRVAGTTTPTTKLSGTKDWTKVTATVTTAATTRYIGVLLRNTVVGNISDAWFDDITLTPTTNTTRTAV